jgi:ribosomal protein S18 acetylase RimI-like enzyme
MVIDLEEMPPRPFWSDGITVRTMQGLEEARDVIWAIEEAFRDHWGYVEQPFETEYQRWLHFIKNDEQYDPTLWFLAVEGDKIVGISCCKAKTNEDPDMAWVSTLGVRKPWRRKGIALALLHHTFREFYRRGKRRVGLGVDGFSLTGATRLYEKAGMKSVRQFAVFEKEIRSGRDIVRRSLD